MTELLEEFIQVLEGPATDRDDLRQHWERWVQEVGPASDGWLGATAGITDDGLFLALLRYASEEAMRRDEHRQAQQAWFGRLRHLLDGELVVRNCMDVGRISDGGSDDAGYVVFIQGHSTDMQDIIHRLAETEESSLGSLRVLLGGYVAAHEDGSGFTQALYFRTEDEAESTREKVAGQIAHVEEMSGYVSDVQRFRVRDPWLHNP